MTLVEDNHGIPQDQVENMVKAWCEQTYFETGRVPNSSQILDKWMISFPVVHILLPQLAPWLRDLRNSGEGLAPKAFVVAQMELSTTDRRSIRTKLKAANVTIAEYERIKRNPKFMEYMRTEAKRRFGDTDVTADLELIKNVEDGDLNAIRYFNEMTGRSSSPEAVNISKVLATIMEILVSYVDPETLKVVAHELESRVIGNILETHAQEVRPETAAIASPIKLELNLS